MATTTVTYCKPCDRSFRNQTGLKMHLANSSRHRSTSSSSSSSSPPSSASQMSNQQSSRYPLQTPIHKRYYSPEPYITEIHTPEYACTTSYFPSSSPPSSSLSSPELYVYTPSVPAIPYTDSTPGWPLNQPTLQRVPQTFACDLCQAGVFFSSDALSQHLMAYHHWCPYNCGMAFSNEVDMQSHMTQPHPYSIPLATYNAPEPEVQVGMPYNGNTWSMIPETTEAVEVIRRLRHDVAVLDKANYHMHVLNNEQLNGLRKCRTCNKTLAEVQDKECYFHTGIKVKTDYTCCKRHYRETPCQSRATHNFEPITVPIQKWEFFPTPVAIPHKPRRAAVALDCEMGADVAGQPVLIQLSVVDYFSGETLINSLVNPDRRAKNLNTRYSGVTQQMMAEALSTGNFLNGSAQAREKLWSFIDSDTVLVGHALNNDLNVLHLIHLNIVDSCILVPTLEGSKMSLKALSKELLEKNVQRGKNGHDCVEDALAAREVVIWCGNHWEEISERRAIADVQVAARYQAKLVKDKEKRERKIEKDIERGRFVGLQDGLEQLRTGVQQISLAVA